MDVVCCRQTDWCNGHDVNLASCSLKSAFQDGLTVTSAICRFDFVDVCVHGIIPSLQIEQLLHRLGFIRIKEHDVCTI